MSLSDLWDKIGRANDFFAPGPNLLDGTTTVTMKGDLTWEFMLVFVGIWAIVSFGLSAAGWWGLANAYRTDRAFPKERWSFESARIGEASYRAMLTMAGDAEGLYIRLGLPMLLFHPPLFIPWSHVTALPEITFLLQKMIPLRIAQTRDLEIRVAPATARTLLAKSPRPLGPT